MFTGLSTCWGSSPSDEVVSNPGASPQGGVLPPAWFPRGQGVFSLNPIEGYEPPVLSGHRDGIVGIFFTGVATQKAAIVEGKEPPILCTLSRDGGLFSWGLVEKGQGLKTNRPKTSKKRKPSSFATEEQEDKNGSAEMADEDVPAPSLAGGSWALLGKEYFNQRGAKVTCYDFHKGSGILVTGMSSGVFDLHRLPEFECLQTLSIIGCAKLGQLLVWEWRSDSYVLKQQGHFFDISTAAFSPDGSMIATGSDDRKAPVTAVAFIPSGNALVSASLDGTVRAYDLLRYRNFRTMTSPTPVQFGSLAVDPAGEIVAAGTADTFQIYVWSLKTGRLLDILAGHEGPISCLAFSPTESILASGSWDKTVRTWDVFNGKSAIEIFQHSHDVLALGFRPDGKQLAASTLDGTITFWNPQEGEMQSFIEGRRDIKGGRLQSDRRAAGNLSSGACFTSVTYSADGSFIIAGGASKFVCIYDVAEKIMLRRFQVTQNRSLDGVLDMLNSKNMTDAGPLQLIDHEEKDEDVELLQGIVDAAGAVGVPGNKKKPAARTRCVTLSPTGRCWAAATTEGLLLYSLDDGLVFDPTDLTEDLTPAACHTTLAAGSYVRALLIALRLGDNDLLRHCILSTPVGQVGTVAGALPSSFSPQVLGLLADLLNESPHVEFILMWVRTICVSHGRFLEGASSNVAIMPAMRSLQKALSRMHEDMATSCESNIYTLEFLTQAGKAAAKK
eukprot:gene14256-20229_t